MSKKEENCGFSCEHCGCPVLPLTNGSYRNHCPDCLHSKHLDVEPGDRLNDCRGLMAPVSVEWKSGKGWQIVHCCLKCGHTSRNKVARDTVQSDAWGAVVGLTNAVVR